MSFAQSPRTTPYHIELELFALQQIEALDFRFGSKADIEATPSDVRFTPKSGHRLRPSGCPRCANSRHAGGSNRRNVHAAEITLRSA